VWALRVQQGLCVLCADLAQREGARSVGGHGGPDQKNMPAGMLGPGGLGWKRDGISCAPPPRMLILSLPPSPPSSSFPVPHAGVKTNGTKNFIVIDGSMSTLIR